MSSIKEMYTLSHHPTNGGIEGYHIQKKYLDPEKIKFEKRLSASLEKPLSASQSKQAAQSKKTTFID